MRVSVDESDPGYRPDVMGGRYHATVNGKRVKRCVTADSDKGYAVKFVLGPGGKHIIDRDHVRRTRVFGKVAIFKNGEPVS